MIRSSAAAIQKGFNEEEAGEEEVATFTISARPKRKRGDLNFQGAQYVRNRLILRHFFSPFSYDLYHCFAYEEFSRGMKNEILVNHIDSYLSCVPPQMNMIPIDVSAKGFTGVVSLSRYVFL